MVKKIKLKNLIIIAFLFIGIVFILSPTKTSKVGEVLTPSDNSNKIILKNVIIDKIREKNELITMEVDLSQKITIDNSWGSLGVFKKISEINYLGTGTYTIDFINLKSENIDIKDKIVTIKLPKPEIKYINIDDNKTTCKATENGLLRFGEIKITPSENQQLHLKVLEKMSEKMGESELYDKAILSSKEAVKTLISMILNINAASQYEVNVEFEK